MNFFSKNGLTSFFSTNLAVTYTDNFSNKECYTNNVV